MSLYLDQAWMEKSLDIGKEKTCSVIKILYLKNFLFNSLNVEIPLFTILIIHLTYIIFNWYNQVWICCPRGCTFIASTTCHERGDYRLIMEVIIFHNYLCYQAFHPLNDTTWPLSAAGLFAYLRDQKLILHKFVRVGQEGEIVVILIWLIVFFK